MRILATTDRSFPSRAIEPHLQDPRGYWLPFIGVSRAKFSSSSPFYPPPFTSFLHEHSLFHIEAYLSIYLSVSSLSPRSTYLLERSLHVFVVCSPCWFRSSLYRTCTLFLDIEAEGEAIIFMILSRAVTEQQKATRSPLQQWTHRWTAWTSWIWTHRSAWASW